MRATSRMAVVQDTAQSREAHAAQSARLEQLSASLSARSASSVMMQGKPFSPSCPCNITSGHLCMHPIWQQWHLMDTVDDHVIVPDGLRGCAVHMSSSALLALLVF